MQMFLLCLADQAEVESTPLAALVVVLHLEMFILDQGLTL
jgi:hypothetical protein